MLPVLELIRLEECHDAGTFGVLRLNKAVFCVTLEPADRLNAPNLSSIPAQQYLLRRVMSGRFGETFEVFDVPGRTLVRMHPGNRVIETEGCILLGQYFGKLAGDRAVLNSGATFAEFMRRMAGHDLAHLTIREVY
jgi:hypothetical protein